MATATQHTSGGPSDRKPIWDVPIEVIGGCGEFSSGKTLFGLTIDPANTKVWDNEGSSAAYIGLGFTRVDMARRMMEDWERLHPKGEKPDFKPIDRFNWWRHDVRNNTPPGKYSVLMLDPVSEIESGLVDYVKKNSSQFGLTEGQINKSSGLLWGAVKDFWESILDDLRCRCQTFYFVAHMRDEYRGNTPTGQREAKGKETLSQLASLYLHFERKKDNHGNVPDVPSANVLKSRVAITRLEGGRPVIIPVLPPRLPEATPQAIRAYIVNPPDYHKLKAKERLQDNSMTEDEKLRLQAYISENNRDAEQAALSRTEKAAAAVAAQAALAAARQAATVPARDQSADAAQSAIDKTAARGVEMVTPDQERQIRDLLPQVYTRETAGNFLAVLGTYGAEKIADLSASNATNVIAALCQLKGEKLQGEAVGNFVGKTGTEPTKDGFTPPVGVPASTLDQVGKEMTGGHTAGGQADSNPPFATDGQAGDAIETGTKLRLETLCRELKVQPVKPIEQMTQAEAAKLMQSLESQRISLLPNNQQQTSPPPAAGMNGSGANGSGPANDIQKQQIRAGLADAFEKPEYFQFILDEFKAPGIDSLTSDQANFILTTMRQRTIERHGDGIRQQQLDRIKKLAGELSWSKDEMIAYLKSINAESFRVLSYDKADSLINQLLARQLGFNKSPLSQLI